MKNSIKRLSARILMVTALTWITAASCNAHPTAAEAQTNKKTETDSVMRKAVGEEIYTTLTSAKKITAHLMLRTADGKNDSTVTTKVGKNEKAILNFILSAPENYQSNDTVYGKYYPNFAITFVAAKEQSCSTYFDFGLGKWSVKNAKGEQVAQFDLPKNDVLRLASRLFPDCTYFNDLINKKY